MAHSGSLCVLVVPSAYPTKEDPIAGTFVVDHARAAATRFKVVVFYPEPVSVRSWLRKPRPVAHRRQEWTDILAPAPLLSSPRALRLASYPLFLAAASRGLRRVARRFRPEVIHAHDLFPAGLLAALMGRLLRIPMVLTVHSSHFSEVAAGRITGWMARRTLGSAQMVLVVSRALREQLLAAGVERERLHVVPNPVSVPANDVFVSRDRKPPQTRAAVVARLTRNKGVDYLLHAVAQLTEGTLENHLELDVIGDGPERPKLENLAHRLGLERKVHFRGSLSRAQVREAIRDADLLVLPSLEETFGIAIIEGMAEGKPILATRSGGPEEIVDDDVGLLVEPGSAEDLAEGLSFMSRHLSDYDPTVIVERARAKYSYEAVGRALDLYRAVVGGSDVWDHG